jgi:hypothetical protein
VQEAELGGKWTLALPAKRSAFAALLELLVSLADCFHYLIKAGRVLHGPKPRKSVAQSVQILIGQQPDGNDAFLPD